MWTNYSVQCYFLTSGNLPLPHPICLFIHYQIQIWQNKPLCWFQRIHTCGCQCQIPLFIIYDPSRPHIICCCLSAHKATVQAEASTVSELTDCRLFQQYLLKSFLLFFAKFTYWKKGHFKGRLLLCLTWWHAEIIQRSYDKCSKYWHEETDRELTAT